MMAVDRQFDVRPPPTNSALVLRFDPVIDLSREQFFQFCQVNSELRLERTADGNITIMPPTGGETGARNLRLAAQVAHWADDEGSGVAFDSSTGFELPNGAVRSPDVAWVERTRLTELSADVRRRFLPLCPDFVIELCSPADSVTHLQRKMEESRTNGARLGWLIDPDRQRVAVYHHDGRVEWHEQPTSLTGDPVLPGLVLSLAAIWDSAW